MERRRADDAIVEYVRSIDKNLAALNIAVTKRIDAHQKEDDDKHAEVDKKINVIQLGLVFTIAAGGAAKLGILDKVLSALGMG